MKRCVLDFRSWQRRRWEKCKKEIAFTAIFNFHSLHWPLTLLIDVSYSHCLLFAFRENDGKAKKHGKFCDLHAWTNVKHFAPKNKSIRLLRVIECWLAFFMKTTKILFFWTFSATKRNIRDSFLSFSCVLPLLKTLI